jgi:hypothetical protein
MDIDDTIDCLSFARAWAGNASFRDRMLSQADDMENCLGIISDAPKAMRWAKCVRFLRWVADQPAAIVHSTTITAAADIGWGIRK